MLQGFTVTTRSGTKYEVRYTVNQQIVIRWEDKDGDPRVKGSAVKVWENCTIMGIEVVDKPSEDGSVNLVWQGNLSMLDQLIVTDATDRYTGRPIYGKGTWSTSPIVSIIRDDGKVLK